jgi:GntR family transcriptional regulator
MNSTLPLYSQLKEELIGLMARGDLVPGDQLPSQRVLRERYGMSHMTIRRAIDELLHEGVIYAIPGKGLYVAERKQDAETDPLLSFTEEMSRRGLKASSQVLAAEIIGASTMLTRALGVEVGTQLVYLHRLRLAGGEPMALHVAYLPHTLCPGLLEHDLEHGSLYAVLRDVYGLHLAHSTRTVEAALADREQAALLQLAPPAALLIVEQLTYLDCGQAIEFSRTTYRGDRYRLPLR